MTVILTMFKVIHTGIAWSTEFVTINMELTVFVNNQLDAQFFFFYLFIPILNMFRATKCSSSGQSNVSVRPLVYVTVCR